MPIRKDETSGIWQVDIRVPGLPRVRCSSGTTERQAAQEYHDKLKADLWRQAKLGEQPDRLFEEAAVRCLRLWEGLRDYDSKTRHIGYWRKQFAGRAIRSLKFDEIADKLPTHTTHKHRKPTPVSPATKNRYLATMRRMLKLCEEWDWLDKCPKFSEFVEPDNRVRWEPRPVIGRLITSMTLQWMRDVSIVAVATGMREDELLSLKPSNVDLPQRNAWVIAEEAKSGYARSVPLNADAMAVLERRIPQARKYVFERPSRDGVVRKISQVDARCLRRACADVGVEDFHFHDFRHTWASWHVQAGTPLMVLKDLGGWETLDMVQRYAHLAPSHLAHHSATVEFWSNSNAKEKTPLVIAA